MKAYSSRLAVPDFHIDQRSMVADRSPCLRGLNQPLSNQALGKLTLRVCVVENRALGIGIEQALEGGDCVIISARSYPTASKTAVKP